MNNDPESIKKKKREQGGNLLSITSILYTFTVYFQLAGMRPSRNISVYMLTTTDKDSQEKSNACVGIGESDQSILSGISGSWIFFLFGSFFLAIQGYFTPYLILSLSGITTIGALVFLRNLRPSRELVLVGLAILIIVILVSFPVSPSVFSGRDAGSYAEAAIRLAHDHSLHSHIPEAAQDFFQIYQEGKALNFPGFFFDRNGALVTQFPLGDIAWFGSGVSLFGIAGLSLANAFTIFLSTIFLFALLRKFVPFSFAFGGAIAAILSFPFVWIQEQTLSENLALPLFLMTSFFLVSFRLQPKRSSWWLVVLPATFLCLARIEGFLILPVIMFLILFVRESRRFVFSHIFSCLIPAIIFSGSVLGIDIASNLPFYRTIGVAVIGHSSSPSVSLAIHVISPLVSVSPTQTFEAFWTYGMLPVFLFAVLGITVLLAKRKFAELIPFFLSIPMLPYFLNSQITPDYPWMIRRFVFALWPSAILLSAFALNELHAAFSGYFPKNKFFRPAFFSSFFFALFMISALPATAPRLFFSENRYLLSDVEDLSQNFSDRDLVLVDRLSSGDPFSLIADPMSTLFGKNAVYFFNPEDLSKIDVSKFEHVYLIVRDGDEEQYQLAIGSKFELLKIRPYTLRTSVFDRETNPSKIPLRNDSVISGSVFQIIPRE